jgi:DNA invertase Pin-like site-specific DNA recombinase
MERYCEIGDCDRLAFRDGKCSTHVKQLQRTGKTAPIAEKLSLEERVIVTHDEMMRAGDDDDEYERARRAMLLACKALGKKEASQALKQSFAAAKARGVRLGRPPKADAEEIRRTLEIIGSVTLTARLLGVSRITVWRVSKLRVLKHRPLSPASPRRAG